MREKENMNVFKVTYKNVEHDMHQVDMIRFIKMLKKGEKVEVERY